MTTERIDIIVSEKGSRVVRKNVEGIGDGARKSASGVDFLKRALAGLGLAALAREALQTIDAYTNLQNRLRSTGLEGKNLTGVYQALLKVANETRSSVEGSVELYSRLALSSKELGVSQQQLIQFTKSLNQAIILSGASATEAQAGLIQLSQGMASGTLRGDELRSVLEQLPAVADVIAKKLGVTRDELRKMGEDGKITAKTIVSAFEASREELEQRFGKTVPTLSQSFQVLKNNTLDTIGRLDAQLGVSERLSKVILILANNTDNLARALGLVTQAAVGAAAAYATYNATLKAGVALQASVEIYNRIKAFVEYRRAIAAGTVVVLGSAEALRQQAVAQAASAEAAVVTTRLEIASKYQEAQATASLTSTRVADIAATQASIAVSREEALAQLASSNAKIVASKRTLAAVEATGALSYALRLQKTATLDLAAAEATRKAAVAELAVLGTQQARVAALNTEALAAQAAAQRALVAVQTQGSATLATATAAQTAAQARLAAQTAAAAGSTTLLGQALDGAKAAMLRLNVAIAANPIGFLATAVSVLLTALVAGTAALVVFRDEILLGVDDVTTLGDYLRALGETLGKVYDDIVAWTKATFGPLVDEIKKFFDQFDISIAGFLRLSAKALDRWAGGWYTAIKIVLAYWNGFGPALQDIVTSAINVVLGKISDFVNKAGELLSPLTSAAGLGQIMAVDLRLSNENEGAAKKFGQDLMNAVKEGAQFDLFQSGVESMIQRAQEIGRARKAAEDANKGAVDLNAPPGTGGTGAGDGGKARKKLQDELQQLISQYDRVYAAQLEVKKATELLDKAQAAGLITAERKAEVLTMINEQLRDQLDPLGAVNRELNKELELLKLTSDAREVETQMRSIQQDLMMEGVKVGEEELKQLREKLLLIQQQTKLDEARNRMLQDSRSGRDEQFGIDVQALKELQEQNKLDPKDQYEILNSMLGGSLEGTQAELDARAAQMEEYFNRIQILRDQNVINEQTASDAIRAIKQAELDFYLSRTATALGAASQLMQTNNKKAFEVGRAAAIGEAIVNTYTSATAAYKSAAAIPYVGWILGPAAAAGAIAAGMAQVSAIRSQQMPAYRTGGEYTVGGNGGVDSQTVAFRATPGERISINTPSQAHAMQNVERMMREDRGGSRGDFTQNLTIVQQGRPNRRTTEQEARKVRKAAQMEYERN